MSARTRTVPASPPSWDRPPLSEEDFKGRVIGTAKWHGWHVHHTRPARVKGGWRTAVEGHAGFPDLALARDGVVILAELKMERANPTLNQAGWLKAARNHGRLWYPRDWPKILEELSAPRVATSSGLRGDLSG